MKKYLAILWLFLVLPMKALCEEHKVYIVYLGEHSGNKNAQEIEDDHHSFLHSIKGSKEEAKDCIVHSYKNIINGFSALLTSEEAAILSEMDGVISVFESLERRIQTTRSWDFINVLEADGDSSRLNGEALLSKANYGKDVIVGVFDSGVWPESESFNDEGMEPIPDSWKGICQHGFSFNSSHCNRKIIGARYYPKQYEKEFGRVDNIKEFRSARDRNGHGTHTASTIGGRRVANVSALGGFANGTASGGSPLVRLAIYKVCWQVRNGISVHTSCPDADTLAAFDDAIADGVHVISLSLAAETSRPYAKDPIAIGALHALKWNIVVSCSAGNEGPKPLSVENVAPWLITVGASSVDRLFPSAVILGNGMTVQGQTVTPFRKMKMHTLVYAGDVEIPGRTRNLTTGLCGHGTLSRKLVKGKVVFCWKGDVFEAMEVKRAGGVAAILGNRDIGQGIQQSTFILPATTILSNDRKEIIRYIMNNTRPTATLTPGRTIIGSKPAPFMAHFTSRGPNKIEPNILKPDITAPGLNILAAWSGASPATQAPGDRRIVEYNFASGTSMSCPHVSAVAALLKAIHPEWSSAAIRSAMMTTARITNNIGMPIANDIGLEATPFDYGAGHIQPSKAADPGLVYDASFSDYLLFICRSTLNFLDRHFKCPDSVPSPSDLNYPSLAIAELNGSMTVKRTVTNVGSSNSLYSVKIEPPRGYSVQISPKTLYFSSTGEKQSFNITVNAKANLKNSHFSFGWYMWSDGIHMVRSPIAVSSA